MLKVAGKERDAVLRTTLRNANPKRSRVGVDNKPGGRTICWAIAAHLEDRRGELCRDEVRGMFPGIDLKYYGRERQLEYDFDVAPQADPSMISLTIEGADKITTDEDGTLVVKTAAGEVRWQKPLVYQESDLAISRLVPHIASMAIGLASTLALTTTVSRWSSTRPWFTAPSSMGTVSRGTTVS